MKSIMLLLVGCALVVGCSRNRSLDDERAGTTTITAAPMESDQQLIRRIEWAVAGDPATSPEIQRVTIDARNGTVVLRGRASSMEARAAIEALAEKTPGVVAVTNELEVMR